MKKKTVILGCYAFFLLCSLVSTLPKASAAEPPRIIINCERARGIRRTPCLLQRRNSRRIRRGVVLSSDRTSVQNYCDRLKNDPPQFTRCRSTLRRERRLIRRVTQFPPLAVCDVFSGAAMYACRYEYNRKLRPVEPRYYPPRIGRARRWQ